MPSLDTNVLLRWLLADVPAQAARVDDLLASGDRFTVDDAALIETVFVLERVVLLSRATVKEVIEVVLSTASIDLDRPLWTAIIGVYTKHPKLSVADVYLALRAQKSGTTPLYTFDRKLASQLTDIELLRPS